MSRILRRPMFRGGRVDARGTGIASGLGYAGGGSVNTPKRGLVDSPGRYSQTSDNLQQWKDELAIQKYKTAPIKYKTPYIQEQFQNFLNNMYKGGIHEVDLAYGQQVAPPMSDEDIATMNLMRKEGGEETAFDLFYEGQLPGSTKNYKELQKDQLAGAKLAGELDSFGIKDTEVKETELTPAQLENIELRKLLEGFTSPKELTEDEQLAEIEKNKAMIHKAYGSGVGDDASRMLMNVGSRWLEEGATVKSGLSKFLGDEAKVESKRSKYKDAATTAAINAFLTGKKTMAEVEGFKAKTGYQIDAKSAADKNKLLNASFAELKQTQPANLKEKARVKGTAELYTQYQNELLNENGNFNVIESKDNTPEQLFIEKYVGDYFMDSGTKEVFKIVILEDGTIGKKPVHQG